ncbi:1-acyl-sn-glycerol-3-phosphate acyltransferase [Mumia sp. zg.B17]|uniref:lysophospholipid acyltransferase family protein n=1 Tax=Mumia sp. zg.B17 TaxID=2855446 RepID=UPI0027E3ADF3|nr:1-acyl-sn-glycerol-3-phosphate acyltransferase [Mumia sp. zg.B17]
MSDAPQEHPPIGSPEVTKTAAKKASAKKAPAKKASAKKASAAKKTATAKAPAAKKAPAKKAPAAKKASVKKAAPAAKAPSSRPAPVEKPAVQIAPKADVPAIGSPVEVITVTPARVEPEPLHVAPEPDRETPTPEATTHERPTFSLVVDNEQEPAAEAAPGIPLAELVSALVEGARSVLGEDWEAKAAELLALVRRRIAGDYEVDEFGLDSQLHAIGMAAIRPLAEKWFRIEVRGAEHIPSDGGALVVANHSGTIPVDAAMTTLIVNDHAQRTLRLLGADLVFELPFAGELARKMGATLACNEDAERLLGDGHIVGVWPEGFKGIGKPYSERYKLQRFGRGGFVSAAMRAGVPIVPVSIVGAEEIYPMIGNVPSLARLLGLPYLPITPFFPWLGPLGLIPLPSKWIIEFGEPVRTDAYPPEAADDPMLVFNVTDQVRETIQQTLYALLVDRGHPFV